MGAQDSKSRELSNRRIVILVVAFLTLLVLLALAYVGV